MEVRIEELNNDDVARIEAQRKWVREHFTPETEHKYDVFEEKLSLIDCILKNNWIEPEETVKLQCLGITLGDALEQKLGLKWVAISDEYGRDPALILHGTTLKIFPLTMISKRIERGEEVDVYDLFEGVSEHIKELRSKWNTITPQPEDL